MINFIFNYLPWFWLAMLILFVVIEAFTMALTTIWAAVAALPMIFISRTALPFRWQLLIFVVLTIVLMVSTRPFAVKKLHLGSDKMNVDSIVGKEVLVTKKVTQFEKGEAKASNGVIWTVTAKDNAEIEAGVVCIVTEVHGNTLEITAK